MNRRIQGGWGYLREGFRLIRQPQIRPFVIAPVVINLLVFGVMIYVAGRHFSDWVDQAVAWLPDWLDFLAWSLWLLFALLLLFFILYGFVFLTNLIGAPFYGLLSERVETMLTGVEPDHPLTLQAVLLMVPQALVRELQKLLYYLPRVLAIFVLGFVPVVQVAAPLLSGAFAAWMMAIQFVDFPADNQRVSFTRMRKTLAQRRLLCMGFGGCVFVVTFIPVLNLFAMPAAVAGGTALWVREFQGRPGTKPVA